MDTIAIQPIRIAAIVYDDSVAVDALMCAFARELIDAGADISGVVQMPPDDQCGPGSPMRLRDVRTGDVIPICQDLGPQAHSCRLDPAGLAEASIRLRRAIVQPSELMFVSKFGKQEVNGQGFRTEFATAILEGKTIITAVKRGLVHNWLDFTGGVGTLLDHRLWVLRDWWSEVKPALH